MEHEFKVGDVVQLKSGGPTMTIETIGNFGMMGSGTRASEMRLVREKQANGRRV
jgi:hypothetical protein